MNDEEFWSTARRVYGDAVLHVAVIWPLRQMRVQLIDGRRALLDEHGAQIGRILPPQ